MTTVIKTDGMAPLRWKWMLHVVYDDRFEVAYGEAWCAGSSATCAMAVLETFGDEDDPHESALVYAWNSATHERAAIPLIRRSDVNAAAV